VSPCLKRASSTKLPGPRPPPALAPPPHPKCAAYNVPATTAAQAYYIRVDLPPTKDFDTIKILFPEGISPNTVKTTMGQLATQTGTSNSTTWTWGHCMKEDDFKPGEGLKQGFYLVNSGTNASQFTELQNRHDEISAVVSSTMIQTQSRLFRLRGSAAQTSTTIDATSTEQHRAATLSLSPGKL
jgi:hypothetical protein